MARRHDSERRAGAAATELAVVLPFVVLLFTVAADFCRVYYYTQTLQNCAYAAALYASGTARPLTSTSLGTLGNLTPVRTAAATDAAVAEGTTLNPPLAASNVQVTYSGGAATATITYDCPLLTPVLGSTQSVHLTRQVTMAVAR